MALPGLSTAPLGPHRRRTRPHSGAPRHSTDTVPVGRWSSPLWGLPVSLARLSSLTHRNLEEGAPADADSAQESVGHSSAVRAVSTDGAENERNGTCGNTSVQHQSTSTSRSGHHHEHRAAGPPPSGDVDHTRPISGSIHATDRQLAESDPPSGSRRRREQHEDPVTPTAHGCPRRPPPVCLWLQWGLVRAQSRHTGIRRS